MSDNQESAHFIARLSSPNTPTFPKRVSTQTDPHNPIADTRLDSLISRSRFLTDQTIKINRKTEANNELVCSVVWLSSILLIVMSVVLAIVITLLLLEKQIL